jgi:tetratricopeptide (TPR) repeat protein
MMSLGNAKSLRELVTSLFAKGEFDEGLRRLRSAGHIPKVVELECVGNMHFYKRELQLAIEKYEAAIAIDAEYMISRYQYLVGTQDEKRGDFVAAFRRYQAAIDIEPSFVDAYVELGGLLGKSGDLKGAAQCYRDAIKLLPNELFLYHNLKSVLEKLKHKAPDEYSTELAAVEVAYAKMERNGALLPRNSKW